MLYKTAGSQSARISGKHPEGDPGWLCHHRHQGRRCRAPSDSVIPSVGYVPVQKLIKQEKNVRILGNAAAVDNLKKSIWGAYGLGVQL